MNQDPSKGLYVVREIGRDAELEVPGDEVPPVLETPEHIPDDPAAAVRETFKLIEGGVAAEVALKQTGASTLPPNKVGSLVKQLLADWAGLDPAQLKKLVEAGFLKLALGSPDEKVQLKALENIAGMPSVGLSPSYAKVTNNFQFNLAPETQALIGSLEEEQK